jgi:uracil phosphoribosyltransferase
MLHVFDHPLIHSEISRLRDRSCPSSEFRQRIRRIASLMVPQVTADLPTRPTSVETPLEVTSGTLLERPVVLAPILRAGIGFLDGFADLLPTASVAHIGLARNEETLQPEPYYFKVPPNLAEADVIVLDPMLATGGSAAEAIRRFACLVAAPEGVEHLHSTFPGLPVFTAALDRCLNEKGYILPGLGDAGDRIFGTA